MKWDKDVMFSILGEGLAFSFNFYELFAAPKGVKKKDFKVSVKFNSFSMIDFELMKLYTSRKGSSIRSDRDELSSFIELFSILDEFKVNGNPIDFDELDLDMKQHYISIVFTALQLLALPDLKKK